jgi:hypothetical protein
MNLDELYEKLGSLLASHFSVCKRVTTNRLIEELQNRVNETPVDEQQPPKRIPKESKPPKPPKKKPDIPPSHNSSEKKVDRKAKEVQKTARKVVNTNGNVG